MLRNQVEQVFAERDILSFADNPFVVSPLNKSYYIIYYYANICHTPSLHMIRWRVYVLLLRSLIYSHSTCCWLEIIQ